MADFVGKIVATDSSYLSAGFLMADINEVIPEADNNSFIERLFKIVKLHQVQVLMPSSGFDIYSYSENYKELAEMGAQAVVSDRNVLEICRDKLLTYQNLAGRFKLPFTTTDSNKINKFPLLAKPRFGKGSRDVIRIDDEADLKFVTSKLDEMIFQEFLPGTEYTIDVLCDLNKKALIAVPRIRLQTKAGISTKGRVVRDPDLELTCLKIAESVGIMGPCCIQMKESSEGELKLIEINPRMGGGTIFSTLAGVNFPALILEMIEHKEITIPKILEITVIRYFEEIVIKNEEKVPVGTNLLAKTNFLQ